MALRQKINDELKEAMKAGDDFKVGVLRMTLAVFHNKEIEKKGKGLEPDLSDEEIIEILGKEAKKRKEAMEIYAKGGRNDLAEKESRELEIINKYLPEQLSEAEIEKAVIKAMEKTGAKEIKDMGKAMAEAMKELSARGGSATGGKGRVDASAVSEMVKKRLGQQ